MTLHIGLLISQLLLAAAAAAAPAFKPEAPALRADSSSSGVLTRAELLVCIQLEEQIKEEQAAHATASVQQETQSLAIEAQAKQLAETQRSAKPSDRVSQDNLSRRIELYNQQVAAGKTASLQLEQATTLLNGRIERRNANCASRSYDAKERESVLVEYRSQLAAPASGTSSASGSAASVAPSSVNAFAVGLGLFDKGQYEAAFALWLPLAEQGSPAAQFNVAAMYEQGQGVRRSDVEAARWFLEAAKRQDGAAQLKVGGLYEAGTGVARDASAAAFWYDQAASNTKRDAMSVQVSREAREKLGKLRALDNRLFQEIVMFDGGRFVLQSSSTNVCVIALQGYVNLSAGFAFEDILKRSKRKGCLPPVTLMLESPGGEVLEGIELGRTVRYEAMHTVARYSCASSCATIFLGGVERILNGSQAGIGFHQMRRVADGQKIEDGECVISRDNRELTAMRRYLNFIVPAAADAVYKLVMETPCDSIEWVGGQRAVSLGVATKVENESVDVFGPVGARQETPPVSSPAALPAR